MASDENTFPIDTSNHALWNTRKRNFAEAYVEISMRQGHENGAAIRAYRRSVPLSKGNEQTQYNKASLLHTDPEVQAMIAALRGRPIRRHAATAERIIQELERLALANVRDTLIETEDGEDGFTLDKLDPDTAAAISGYEVTHLPGGKKRVKLKFYDKAQALTQLCNILGLNKNSTLLTTEMLEKELDKLRRETAAMDQLIQEHANAPG